MARNYQWDEKNQDEQDNFVSRSQRKRDSASLQSLGERLTKLPVNRYAKLELSEELQNALREFFRLKAREAKRRQIQYIGRLMREQDNIQAIEEMLDDLQL